MKKEDFDTLTLDQLPLTENDTVEFKSSRIKSDPESLKNKLCKAVSGFANSGGGYFIVGIDEKTGDADGGLPMKVGKQSIGDWVDNIIHQGVEPVPLYYVKLITEPNGRGIIDKGLAVLIVCISESHTGPHMADNAYYIRAGAHTTKARNFIVEAIRAKRFQSKPKLTHLFRFSPTQQEVLQLGILALTDAPAVNTIINLSPVPEAFQRLRDVFPIVVPMIDRNNPFYFDVSLYAGSTETFGNNVELRLEYDDLYSNIYVQSTIIGVDRSAPPIRIGNDSGKKIIKSLEDIEKSINKLNSTPKRINKPTNIIHLSVENIFEYIEEVIPDLIAEIKIDLVREPFVREFILFGKNWEYFENPKEQIFMYFFEDHPYLRNKLRILENCNLVYEISFNSVDRFVLSEQLVRYLINKKD